MSKRTASTEPGDAAGAALQSRQRAVMQQRSRERLEKILSAARSLIAERGSDQMKMSDIASLAGISIGSLYQYFPDKRAIIKSLAERYNAENRRCIEEALEGVEDQKSLLVAFADLFDQYYDLFLAEPVMRDIWSGMQADKALMALELKESRHCGALLADAMRRAHPKANARRVRATAFLIWQLGEATMRLAVTVDRAEGDMIVAAFKRMVERELANPGE
jgi:AcrR family transcriptional regulator